MKEPALFIKTPVPMLLDHKLEPDMGLLYCATYVGRHCEVAPVYADLSLDGAEVLGRYLDRCRIFLFSTFTANYHLTLGIVRRLREKAAPGSVFIAGGHHASAIKNAPHGPGDRAAGRAGRLFRQPCNHRMPADQRCGQGNAAVYSSGSTNAQMR